MKRIILILMMIGIISTPSFAQQRTVLFCHQSVGRYIIANPNESKVGDNPTLAATVHIRTLFDSEVEFWDHDYSYEGSWNADGVDDGTTYAYTYRCGSNPSNDAGCVGLEHLVGNVFRTTPIGDTYSSAAEALAWRNYASSFDIFIVKPGYRDIHLIDDTELESYKTFLNDASDWWNANNSGKYFVIMTASSLRQYSDYASDAGFTSDAQGIERTTRYKEFEDWLTKVWVCRHPENRVFAAFHKCTNQTGTTNEINFTKDAYKSSDHHLNAAGSDALQSAFVDFINGLVEDMNNGVVGSRPAYRVDY